MLVWIFGDCREGQSPRCLQRGLWLTGTLFQPAAGWSSFLFSPGGIPVLLYTGPIFKTFLHCLICWQAAACPQFFLVIGFFVIIRRNEFLPGYLKHFLCFTFIAFYRKMLWFFLWIFVVFYIFIAYKRLKKRKEVDCMQNIIVPINHDTVLDKPETENNIFSNIVRVVSIPCVFAKYRYYVILQTMIKAYIDPKSSFCNDLRKLSKLFCCWGDKRSKYWSNSCCFSVSGQGSFVSAKNWARVY